MWNDRVFSFVFRAKERLFDNFFVFRYNAITLFSVKKPKEEWDGYVIQFSFSDHGVGFSYFLLSEN